MVDFTVLVLAGAYPTSVAVTGDMLRAARALAPGLAVRAPTWRMCSVDGGLVALQGGLSIETVRLPARRESSTWLVPGIGTVTAAAVSERLARDDAVRAAASLARHAAAGGPVAASCAGVFLLQAAGLLPGRRVTTTWWLGPLLARMAPGCTVDVDVMVCADGNLTTAGAAFAQTDLMLHLLRAKYGSELSDAVARSLLIDGRQAQSPYVVPELLANGEELVTRIIALVEANLSDPPSVGKLAEEFAMSERTLARHVNRATGRSPIALVQGIRIRQARSLLETTRLTVDQIAEAVGYQDSSSLRRAMRKAIGATPSRYRPTSGRA